MVSKSKNYRVKDEICFPSFTDADFIGIIPIAVGITGEILIMGLYEVVSFFVYLTGF